MIAVLSVGGGLLWWLRFSRFNARDLYNAEVLERKMEAKKAEFRRPQGGNEAV